MPRGCIILGFVISTVVHVGLLCVPSRPAPPPAEAVVGVVPLLETALAQADAIDPGTVEPDEPRAPVEEPAADAPPPPPPAPAPTSAPPAPEPEPPRRPAPTVPIDALVTAPDTGPDDPGDFAGASDGPRSPVLRIDWGSVDEARAIRESAGMLVVVLEADDDGPMITHAVEPVDGTWRRRSYLPTAGTARFSNRLRIVDDVPAFAPIRDAVAPGPREHLAVLVPSPVERLLQRAQIEAASAHGLALEEIGSLAGRFTLTVGGIAFEITYVEP